MTTFAFDVETAIEPDGPGRWLTTISSDWNINTNPNGGYAATPLLRAMAAEAEGHPDPVSLTTHYLRPALGDQDATIITEVARRGRRTSTVRGSMHQDGKPRLESVATFADLSAIPDGSEIDGSSLEIPPPDLAPVEQCVNRLELRQGVVLALASRVEIRIDPRYAEPGVAGEAVTAGWIRLLDGRAPDSLTLPLFADSFPPSVFGLVGQTGWVPTIELTVHVRRRPAPGWIRARFVTREIAGATLIEDGTLWDETDRIVARSRQLAMAVD
ncbi:MAG: thioesterase family protein [Acidimicrobiales bacterium]